MTLATPGVRDLIASYCKRFGITGYTPSADGSWWGAFDRAGLCAVVAYVEQPTVRYVTDWYAATGLRGQRGSSALVDLVRACTRPVVGGIVASNREARRFIAKRGGREEVVMVMLPPVGV